MRSEEVFNCELIYSIIHALMQTIFIGNQSCARDTGVKPDGCCLCLSGGSTGVKEGKA